jgi:hypothetical protein
MHLTHSLKAPGFNPLNLKRDLLVQKHNCYQIQLVHRYTEAAAAAADVARVRRELEEEKQRSAALREELTSAANAGDDVAVTAAAKDVATKATAEVKVSRIASELGNETTRVTALEAQLAAVEERLLRSQSQLDAAAAAALQPARGSDVGGGGDTTAAAAADELRAAVADKSRMLAAALTVELDTTSHHVILQSKHQLMTASMVRGPPLFTLFCSQNTNLTPGSANPS